MRIQGLLIFLFCAVSGPAFAKCPIHKIVYTDGQYELHFDQKEKSALEYSFKITDTETGVSFPGSIVYNLGYSIPNVGIKIPCNKGEKGNPPGFCGYSGTLYEINGRKTKYAFETGYDENNPVLFPKLGQKFYYAMMSRLELIKHIPKDVWYIKECRK